MLVSVDGLWYKKSAMSGVSYWQYWESQWFGITHIYYQVPLKFDSKSRVSANLRISIKITVIWDDNNNRHTVRRTSTYTSETLISIMNSFWRWKKILPIYFLVPSWVISDNSCSWHHNPIEMMCDGSIDSL